MKSMLDITKSTLEYRKGDIPASKDQKFFREYFEKGCLCVGCGDICCPPEEPDEVACLYYIMWCRCSRNYSK